jgi:anti-sigma factor RsiW
VTKKPMTCQEFVDVLPAYRERELSAGERTGAEEHLAGCEQCATYARGYDRTIELAKAASAGPSREEKLPEALVRKILAAHRGS